MMVDNTHNSNMLNHPVYSDFSHIAIQGGLDNTMFAVSLREDDGNTGKMIKRILPLTKIIPINKSQDDNIDDDSIVCERPECIHQRDQLSKLLLINDPLKKEIIDCTNKITQGKNQLKMTEQSLKELQLNNQRLVTEIENMKIYHETLFQETKDCEIKNVLIRNQLQIVTASVEKLRLRKNQLEKELNDTLKSHEPVTIHFSKCMDTSTVSSEKLSVYQLGRRRE